MTEPTAAHRVRRGDVLNIDGTMSAEASELDLAPGDFPQVIVLVDHDNQTERFYRGEALPGFADDRFGGYVYASNLDVKLTIYND